MVDQRRLSRQDFRKEDYDWPSATFRLKIFFNPSKFGFYLGKYGWPGGQKYQGFTPGEFSWIAKWAFRGGFIILPIILYNTYYNIHEIEIKRIFLKDVPGLFFIGFTTLWAYNFRRSFRNGLAARIAEEEERAPASQR